MHTQAIPQPRVAIRFRQIRPPLQGSFSYFDPSPGRCPGLTYSAPLGLRVLCIYVPLASDAIEERHFGASGLRTPVSRIDPPTAPTVRPSHSLGQRPRCLNRTPLRALNGRPNGFSPHSFPPAPPNSFKPRSVIDPIVAAPCTHLLRVALEVGDEVH